MKLELLDGESHTSMCSPAFRRGLKWIFGKKSIANRMIQTYQEQDFRTAVNEYHELKKTKPGEYSFQEAELNNLGYALLFSGKVVEAIEIFKLNIENFPGSANVYDSLGEAYATSGETDKAIKFYKKALDVDPQTSSAIEALKRLETEP
jgi:tetratricopeptide (TPR) repeat protein